MTDKDVYTITGVTRDDSGIYKCSLLDKDEMESTQIVTVSCEWTNDGFAFSIFPCLWLVLVPYFSLTVRGVTVPILIILIIYHIHDNLAEKTAYVG